MHTIITSMPMLATLAAPQQPPSKPPRRVPPLSAEQEYFHNLVDELVKLNQRYRLLFPDHKRTPRPDCYAMYHATVQAGIGRDCGKSEYILRNAKAGDLIIVPNEKLLRIQFRHAPCDVIDAGELQRHYLSRCRPLHQMRYQTIWIDEPYAVFEKVNRQELYFQLARDTDQTFILLGP